MSLPPDHVGLGELRQNTKRYVRKIRQGGGPYAITRRGEWVAVLLSAEQFQELVSRKPSRRAKTPVKASKNGAVKPNRAKKAASGSK